MPTPTPTPGAGQSRTQFMPIGDWKPDVPTPINDGMPFSLNLVPKATGFYGPEYQLTTFASSATTVFGTALKVHGATHSRPPDGDNPPRYYVGTFATAAGASRLLAREEQGAWENVSKAGGYSCTANTPWRFANFGLKVLATNRSNRMQISDGGPGDLFRDINNNLRGEDVATVAGFAVLINTQDLSFGEGTQIFRVWWSAIGNAENFPDPLSNEAITVQSGFRDLFGGGRLRRIIPGVGGADAIVVAERKIWRMRFVGPPQTFQFDEVETDQGTAISGSVAAFNETFFFYGHNGFYWFDGSNSTPIGQGTMDQFFLDDLETSSTFGFTRSIEATVDAENKNYVISYRSAAAAGDGNDKVLRFNWITGKWSNSEVRADSLGSVDSFASETDSPRLVFINDDFQIKRSGTVPAEAIIEGREITLDTGSYYMVRAVLPYVDTDDVVARVRFRDTQGQALKQTTEKSLQKDGYIRFAPDLPTGRFVRCRLRIPAASTWTAITGVLYEFQEFMRGSRRTS